MRRSDIVSGVLLVLFSAVMILVVVPIQIRSASEYGLDPKFFPVALLWLLMAVAALLVLTRLRGTPEPTDEDPPMDGRSWLFISAFSAFLLAAYLAIGALGFIAAGVLVIAALMLVLRPRPTNWLEIAGVAVLAPPAIYFALARIFGIALPSGDLVP